MQDNNPIASIEVSTDLGYPRAPYKKPIQTTAQGLKYNTIQYNTIQYNTIQYNTSEPIVIEQDPLELSQASKPIWDDTCHK